VAVSFILNVGTQNELLGKPALERLRRDLSDHSRSDILRDSFVSMHESGTLIAGALVLRAPPSHQQRQELVADIRSCMTRAIPAKLGKYRFLFTQVSASDTRSLCLFVHSLIFAVKMRVHNWKQPINAQTISGKDAWFRAFVKTLFASNIDGHRRECLQTLQERHTSRQSPEFFRAAILQQPYFSEAISALFPFDMGCEIVYLKGHPMQKPFEGCVGCLIGFPDGFGPKKPFTGRWFQSIAKARTDPTIGSLIATPIFGGNQLLFMRTYDDTERNIYIPVRAFIHSIYEGHDSITRTLFKLRSHDDVRRVLFEMAYVAAASKSGLSAMFNSACSLEERMLDKVLRSVGRSVHIIDDSSSRLGASAGGGVGAAASSRLDSSAGQQAPRLDSSAGGGHGAAASSRLDASAGQQAPRLFSFMDMVARAESSPRPDTARGAATHPPRISSNSFMDAMAQAGLSPRFLHRAAPSLPTASIVSVRAPVPPPHVAIVPSLVGRDTLPGQSGVPDFAAIASYAEFAATGERLVVCWPACPRICPLQRADHGLSQIRVCTPSGAALPRPPLASKRPAAREAGGAGRSARAGREDDAAARAGRAAPAVRVAPVVRPVTAVRVALAVRAVRAATVVVAAGRGQWAHNHRTCML